MGRDFGSDTGKKTVGVIGTGLVGKIAARIFKMGFGCDVVAHDVAPDSAISDPPPAGLGIPYATLDELLERSDIITLHVPLTPETTHIINMGTLKKMKRGVTIVNTSRGGLIDIKALIKGLEEGIIGNAGLDVIEGESPYFFSNWSSEALRDDDISMLLGFPNVAITPHQAFFTGEGLKTIAHTTLVGLNALRNGSVPPQETVLT